ncbi:MAG TPA: hypothetical protein VHV55_06290 [Pirellulales bacterium]|jgi:hypothetical protein|nr:hypothetical protein [Pirellulales bacterium]
MSWAWEQEILETLPRFPKSKPQRDVAGRHYLTKPEINTLYFATHKMRRPRGWRGAIPVGRYWRAALVLFFNYGFDTGMRTSMAEDWLLENRTSAFANGLVSRLR